MPSIWCGWWDLNPHVIKTPPPQDGASAVSPQPQYYLFTDIVYYEINLNSSRMWLERGDAWASPLLNNYLLFPTKNTEMVPGPEWAPMIGPMLL